MHKNYRQILEKHYLRLLSLLRILNFLQQDHSKPRPWQYKMSTTLAEPRELSHPLHTTLGPTDPTMRSARGLAVLARREDGVRARAERRVTAAGAANRRHLRQQFGRGWACPRRSIARPFLDSRWSR